MAFVDTLGNNFLGNGVTAEVYLLDGNDVFAGTSTENDQVIYGGDGNDEIGYFGTRSAVLDGGEGDDRLSAGANYLSIDFFGGGGNDTIFGGEGGDTIDGGDGNDISRGGGASDNIHGGAGEDQLFGDDGGDYLSGGTQQDTIHGGDDGDQIDGGEGDDILHGDAGNDAIEGGFGDDTLFGGAGQNLLYGGFGNDILNSGPDGGDRLVGGDGNDLYFVFSDATAIESADGGTDTVIPQGAISWTLAANIEHLFFGTDAVNGTGNGLANTITGNAKSNIVSGLGGNDTLLGDAGDDTLAGGLGKDILNGGPGADRFDFNSIRESVKGANRDVIAEFTRGQDDIDLGTIDAKTGVGGNQKFKFIGKQGFHKEKGELHYVKKAGYAIVQGDVNGDGKADFEIKVDNVAALSAGDFLL